MLKRLEDIKGELYVGMDIGRKNDLTVIWILEKLENIKYTRKIEILPDTPFKKQEEILYGILSHKNFRRCCIDATGLGMQLAEGAIAKFGKYRVEAINFSPKVKEELAYNLKINFDDRAVYIPAEREIRDDLHSVRKITTSAGNIRFDVEKSDVSGHADRFWALALALHASQSYKGPIYIATRNRRKSIDMTRGLYDGIDFDTW